jgi:Skp family chaperone for outer membrane proteins
LQKFYFQIFKCSLETKASPFQKKYIALILFILISGAILYGQSEAEIDSISEINYKNVVEDLDVAKLSKTDRKSLLAKLIEEDPELQEIESWGEEFEDAIDDQEIFNEEVLEEEVEDESELSKELMEDSELELAQGKKVNTRRRS